MGHVRDEAVLALGYRFWDQIKLYGIYGYSMHSSTVIGERRNRFEFGVEWSKQVGTGWRGQPFAAFDMELRQDQDFTANTTIQVGWQWKTMESSTGLRVALQYYDGGSPYGQFFTQHEQWVGLGLFLDF